jgi:hypothetical protein
MSQALFVGFSFFRADTSQAGLQSQLFSAFMVSPLHDCTCEGDPRSVLRHPRDIYVTFINTSTSYIHLRR